jgi:signal transduction histidine kinase
VTGPRASDAVPPAVLVVEDDAGQQELQRRRLERAGYAVVTASTAAEGLALLRTRRFDLLVLDHRLPGGSTGLDLYREVRARGDRVPAILVTAFSGEDVVVEALRAGVFDFLPKSPDYVDHLPAVVDRVLEEVRIRRELVEAHARLTVEQQARAEAERLTDELQDAAARQDEFLAMLAHELRNPLAAVRDAVTVAALDDARRGRALEIARRQSEQLGRLVDDLLDVARIRQGRISLRTEPLSMAAIVERAVESARPLLESRGLRATVALPSAPVFVAADPARLEQVLVNLLSNAAKYTEPGGRVDVVAERRDGEAAIRVRDTGIGIAPEMLPRVWDLFTQADRALDRAPGGLGIGLTVARRLVELHGGRIEARSDGLGKGAEFVVTLPALARADVDAAPPSAAEPTARGAARVLVVEDNRDAAESLAMLLDTVGHRVTVVHDAGVALEATRAREFDVALIDIGLPGMDGYELARQIRDLGRRPVLVAVTGYGAQEDKERARGAGFDHHLVKPVDFVALQDVLRGVPEP